MKTPLIGAEAHIIEQGDTVSKIRYPKPYRHAQLDAQIRVSRTKREASFLERVAKLGIAVPKLLTVDLERATLVIEKIPGVRLKEIFNTSYKLYAKEIGSIVAQLHKNHLVHGDLTTSNMLVHLDRLYLIDFGLSMVTRKIEDFAVDLHLLEQAVESAHAESYPDCLHKILEGYQWEKRDAVIARLEIVKQRGRYKQKQ